MKDRLNYISSDKYKVEIFKRALSQEILEMKYLQKQVEYPLSENNDNVVINKILSNLESLYDEMNGDIAINELLTKLILIEKDFMNEVYRNGVNIKLENLLFFIVNAKLDLLLDTKSAIEKVVELTQLAMTSENEELQKAGSVIISELVKNDGEYESISDRLNSALMIIEDYNKALEIISNYNITLKDYQKYRIDENLINEANLKEAVSLCEKVRIIIDDNCNIIR